MANGNKPPSPLDNWTPGTSPIPEFTAQGAQGLIGSESITPGTLQPVQYGGGSVTNFATLLPNYTSFPSNPTIGDVIYRSDQNMFYMYAGSSAGWIQISLQNLDQLANGTTYAKTLTQQVNLIADSEFMFPSVYWSGVSGSFSINKASTSTIGNPVLQYGPGTGVAVGYHWVTSKTIPVTAGNTYTISGYIDGTDCTTGGAYFGVWDTGITTQYGGTSAMTAGGTAQVTKTFTVPAGVTEVVVLCDTGNVTLKSGGYILFRAPMLVAGSNVGAYTPGSMDWVSGSPLIDFGASGMVNNTLDYIGNGTTYARVLAAGISSGKINLASSSSLTGQLERSLLTDLAYVHQSAWSSATSYIQGDTVTYTGNVYLCLTNNSNSTPSTSNSNWQLVGPTSLDNLNDGSTYARILAAGISSGKINLASTGSLLGNLERSLLTASAYVHQSNWSSSTSYSAGDVVIYNSNTYVCLTANSNSAPPNSNWQLVGPATIDNLANGSTYAKIQSNQLSSGQIDFALGYLNANLDNITNGSTYGRMLLSGLSGGKLNLGSSGSLTGTLLRANLTANTYVHQSTWNSGTAYQVGDTVTYVNGTWFCTTANTGQAPGSGGDWFLIGPANLDGLPDGSGWYKVANVDSGTNMITTNSVDNRNISVSASATSTSLSLPTGYGQVYIGGGTVSVPSTTFPIIISVGCYCGSGGGHKIGFHFYEDTSTSTYEIGGGRNETNYDGYAGFTASVLPLSSLGTGSHNFYAWIDAADDIAVTINTATVVVVSILR